MNFEHTKNGEYDNYSFKMTALPLNEPIEFTKVAFAEKNNKSYEGDCMTGEGKYGTWYMAMGLQHNIEGNDKYVTVFMSKSQAEKYSNVPVGKFTITRRPDEIDIEIDGKKIRKMVSTYDFEANDGDSSSSSEITVLSEKQLKVLKVYKEQNLDRNTKIKFDGEDKLISEVIPTAVLDHPEEYL